MKTQVSLGREDINALINRMTRVQIEKLFERHGIPIHDSKDLKDLRREVKSKVSDETIPQSEVTDAFR